MNINLFTLLVFNVFRVLFMMKFIADQFLSISIEFFDNMTTFLVIIFNVDAKLLQIFQNSFEFLIYFQHSEIWWNSFFWFRKINHFFIIWKFFFEKTYLSKNLCIMLTKKYSVVKSTILMPWFAENNNAVITWRSINCVKYRSFQIILIIWCKFVSSFSFVKKYKWARIKFQFVVIEWSLYFSASKMFWYWCIKSMIFLIKLNFFQKK